MNAPRVLVLGSYPTRRPIHGGQLRLAQVVAAYRRHGLAVRQVNVFVTQPVYSHVGPIRHWLTGAGLDMSLSRQHLRDGLATQVPFVEDLASGETVAANDKRVAIIERYAGRVDWVHVEQPWLFPLVQRLRERGRLGRFRLIYGSQNIEHPLKRAIFNQYRVVGGEAALVAIEALETAAAREADLVVAVTAEDARQLSQWTRAPVVLAPNGVQPWSSAGWQKRRWLARLGRAPFALYVASAHPPNIQGFCEAFGESLAALSPLQRVVIAGSVAEHVVRTDWFRRWEALNARRVYVAGLLSASELSALKDLAHSILLPVTAGGGSNLKSAEALYAGSNVVSTPLAMRGFEAYSDLPGVTVASPGLEFCQAVASSLQRPAPPVDHAGLARRQHLTWSSTLAPLTAAIGAAGGGS